MLVNFCVRLIELIMTDKNLFKNQLINVVIVVLEKSAICLITT